MRGTRRRYSRGPKPRYEWAVARQSIALGPAPGTNAVIFDLLEPFNKRYGADLAGFTVARIRGRLDIVYDPVDEAFIQPLSFGIRVANENSIATASNKGVLSEGNDEYADWMWRSELSLRIPTKGQVDGGFNPVETLHVDGKAKRRLDDMGQSLYLFAGQETNGGFDYPTMDVNTILYVLLKRP